MRRAAKVDANQSEIVDHVRAAGWCVHIAAPLGGGFLDLVCAYDGFTALLEAKDGSKSPSERRLTKDQVKFTSKWPGMWAVAESPDQALAALNRMKADYDRRVLDRA